MKHILAGAAIAVGLINLGPASAADLPVAPVYKAAPIAYLPWSRCYAGGTLGYTRSRPDTSITSSDPNFLLSQTLGNVPTTADTNPNGVVVGGTVGCNRQFDRLVIGLEGDLSYSTLDGAFSTTQGFAAVTTTFDHELNAIGTLRARLGYAFSQTMFYATGGLAVGHIEANVNIAPAVPGGSVLAGSEEGWKGGWTIGGGIEHLFSQAWSLKAEYLYYDLGTTNIALVTIAGAPNETGTLSYKNTGHILRLGLNYHF